MVKQDPPPSDASTILFVDDDEAIRELFQIIMESETSYRTLTMKSGEETLRRLEEVRQAHPRLFLLDYWLSGMNAIDLYDQLHAAQELRDVPAIILTACSFSPQQREAVAARHIDICWKPFEVQDLLDCIKRTLHQPRTDALLPNTQEQEEKEHAF